VYIYKCTVRLPVITNLVRLLYVCGNFFSAHISHVLGLATPSG